MAKERDIEDILEEKTGKFRERVSENIDKFKDRVDDARERFEDVREKFDEYKERGEEGWKDVTRFTQKNPSKALGLALLIGAAFGILFFGGRNRD